MKFHGFYRLCKTTPAPVLAMFADKSGVYIQQSIDGEILSNFRKIEKFDKDRVFIVNEMKISPPIAGEDAIYSYEYKKGSVAIGSLQAVKRRIKQLIEQGDVFSSHEFAQLDAAHFTEIPELVKQAAIKCFQKLNKQSAPLSRKWLEGSQIDDSLKNWISLNYSNIDNDVRLRYVGFRISCLRIIIDVIDDLAAFEKTDRNTFLTICIRRTYAQKGPELKREFLQDGYRNIELEINNFFSPIYQKPYSYFKKEVDRRMEPYIDIINNNEVIEQYIDGDSYVMTDLYTTRPSIRLGKEELEILRQTFRGGPRQTERARAAFLLFCVVENYLDFREKLSEKLNSVIEQHISGGMNKTEMFIERILKNIKP